MKTAIVLHLYNIKINSALIKERIDTVDPKRFDQAEVGCLLILRSPIPAIMGMSRRNRQTYTTAFQPLCL